MRSIWKGGLNFGMVSIPCKVYTATDDKRVSFHLIHRNCKSRVTMPRWCPVCERKLESQEINRGYEIGKDQHIILEENDFASLPLKSLKQIEVVEFVKPGQIDIRAYADSYFLSCEELGAKAFRLFLYAMDIAGVVGIAKLTYREREHLSAIRPYGGIMLLQTLHYSDEMRAFEEIKPREVGISEKELQMAQTLIQAMTGDFDHSKYCDDYRMALEKLIEDKIAGVVTTTTPEVVAPADIVEALLASINLAGLKK